jgi:hypothetical protein
MTDRVFVIQQIGVTDSPERRRADEIYEGIIVPAVKDLSLEPYRADLDLTPGAITPKMLAELLNARAVIADLTGRNPNVFYELGVTHSFVRPLVSIADTSKSLPFDAKDERVIELGEYPSTGLGLLQGQKAIASLKESLKIVLADGYESPSPLRDVAASRSVDALAPKEPLAAEMAQMRETLEEIRRTMRPRFLVPAPVKIDVTVLRRVIAENWKSLDPWSLDKLVEGGVSSEQRRWAEELGLQVLERPAKETESGYSDEPPF